MNYGTLFVVVSRGGAFVWVVMYGGAGNLGGVNQWQVKAC